MKRPCLLHYSLSAQYFAAQGWIVVTGATQPSNPLIQLAVAGPSGEKRGHIFLMGMFVLLLNYLVRRRAFCAGPISIIVGTAAGAVLIVLEEFSRIWAPLRTFSGDDLLADGLGALDLKLRAEYE